MLKVLFVDDEVNILNSLRRMLRNNGQNHRMQFCKSGTEALQVLSETQFDIIFSDMRMPMLAGTEFLAIVQQRYPVTIRIALSGYMETGMVLESIKTTHAFLSKPTDERYILTLINRFDTVLQSINNPELKATLSGMTSLPVLPEVYRGLSAALSEGRDDIQAVKHIIRRDIALCAKVLQLCNSAYFGAPTQYLNIDDAIAFIGMDRLRDLVLEIRVFEPLSSRAAEKVLTIIWKRAQVVASVAGKIARAEQLPKEQAEVLNVASLLQDIGEIVLITQRAEQLSEPYTWSVFDGSTVKALEAGLGGNDHSDIGSYLLSLWGIPTPVIECIAHQHKLERFTDRALSLGHYLLAANAIVEARMKCGRSMLTLLNNNIFDKETLQYWYSL